METGIIVFGHGSSVASANEAVRKIAAEAARLAGWRHFETAFLEAEPRLSEAAGKLAAAQVAEILVLPYFLTLGIHLQRDLPALTGDLARKLGIPIRVAPPLDGHPDLPRILADRAHEAGA